MRAAIKDNCGDPDSTFSDLVSRSDRNFSCKFRSCLLRPDEDDRGEGGGITFVGDFARVMLEKSWRVAKNARRERRKRRLDFRLPLDGGFSLSLPHVIALLLASCFTQFLSFCTLFFFPVKYFPTVFTRFRLKNLLPLLDKKSFYHYTTRFCLNIVKILFILRRDYCHIIARMFHSALSLVVHFNSELGIKNKKKKKKVEFRARFFSFFFRPSLSTLLFLALKTCQGGERERKNEGMGNMWVPKRKKTRRELKDLGSATGITMNGEARLK